MVGAGHDDGLKLYPAHLLSLSVPHLYSKGPPPNLCPGVMVMGLTTYSLLVWCVGASE